MGQKYLFFRILHSLKCVKVLCLFNYNSAMALAAWEKGLWIQESFSVRILVRCYRPWPRDSSIKADFVTNFKFCYYFSLIPYINISAAQNWFSADGYRGSPTHNLSVFLSSSQGSYCVRVYFPFHFRHDKFTSCMWIIAFLFIKRSIRQSYNRTSRGNVLLGDLHYFTDLPVDYTKHILKNI